MGKTFHSKQEFKKLVQELGIRAAKAKRPGILTERAQRD